MNPTTSRTLFGALAVSLAAGLFIAASSPVASPSEEITRAVSASGAPSVKQADANTFLDAFSSILVSVDRKHAAAYIDAAKKMRPDLNDRIVAAATDIASTDTNTGETNQVSQHARRCKVCCGDHTKIIYCSNVNQYLRQHPNCVRGACHGE